MVLQAYSIYDKKAQSYGTPFFTTNDATAIRSVHRLCIDPQTMLSANPEDFQLVHIGSFSDVDAALADVSVRVVCECSSLVPQNAENS